MPFVWSLAILLGFLALVARLDAYPATQNYCATFDGTSNTNGISGFFGMSVNSATGTATYGYTINFGGLSAALQTSNPIGTMAWHIHAGWTGATTSGSLTSCPQIGGHYDPNLACSENSQQKSGDCAALGRTLSLGYTYACTSTVYNAGNFGMCEVGDLSGKFGPATTSAGNLVASTGITPYMDPYAAYVMDYGADPAYQWNSIVFHDINSLKILCGKLVLDTNPNSQCSVGGAYGPAYMPAPPPPATSLLHDAGAKNFTSGNMVVAVTITFLVTMSPFFIYWMYNLILEDQKAHAKKQPHKKGEPAAPTGPAPSVPAPGAPIAPAAPKNPLTADMHAL